MKFAVIADVHANLEAFRAVLADAKYQGCTHYAFLGDFVGYCADPKACLDIVRAMDAPCVKGNHDAYSATDLPLAGINPTAAKVIQWTRQQLSQGDRSWLESLLYVRVLEGFTIVHATLNSPELWIYAFDKLAAAGSFACQDTPVCFFGHTHIPIAFVHDGNVRGGSYTKLKVEPGKRYFVNVGSVGQPRDLHWQAAYVIYDLDKGTIELRRCEYDIAWTRRKIREAGLGGY